MHLNRNFVLQNCLRVFYAVSANEPKTVPEWGNKSSGVPDLVFKSNKYTAIGKKGVNRGVKIVI